MDEVREPYAAATSVTRFGAVSVLSSQSGLAVGMLCLFWITGW